MPRKPKRPCRYPGCPRLTDHTYCEEHEKMMQRHYDTFTRGYSTGKRYGRQWRKIRTRYVRKHPLCERCLLEGRYVPVEEVHHIVPLSEGGSNDESNLMSLCHSCHEKMHKRKGKR
jgi:5-methylcytosine-specific restriction protein A